MRRGKRRLFPHRGEVGVGKDGELQDGAVVDGGGAAPEVGGGVGVK